MIIRQAPGVPLDRRAVVGWNDGNKGDLRLLLVLSVRSVPLTQTTWPVASIDRNNGLSVYQYLRPTRECRPQTYR